MPYTEEMLEEVKNYSHRIEMTSEAEQGKIPGQTNPNIDLDVDFLKPNSTDVYDHNETSQETRTPAGRNRVKKFLSKCSNDKIFRQNWIYTLCIYFAFTALGWLNAQLGPSFLDILAISGAQLEQGSWIVTVFYIGYVCGSIVSGVIYKIINPMLLFTISFLLLTAMHVLIPWCFLFELMLLGHIGKGIGAGIIDTAGIAEIFRVWKEKGKPFLIGVNFIFSTGRVLSPLITAPFLMEVVSDNEATGFFNSSSLVTQYRLKHKTNIDNSIDVSTLPYTVNVTQYDDDVIKPRDTDVYIAYLITASLCFLNSVLFLGLYISRQKSKNVTSTKSKKLYKNVRPLSLPVKMVVFILMGFIMALFAALEQGFTTYLSTFCVQYFSWSKKSGAMVTSIVFISATLSTLLSVFVASSMNTVVTTIVLCVLLFVDFCGLALVSIFKIDIGVWIFSVLVGFSKSIIFPLVIGWTNEYFFPVTGMISAFFMVVAMLGSAINPPILGYVMTNISKLSFTYLFLVESILLVMLVVLCALFTRYVHKKYGITFSNTVEIDVNETQTLSKS